MKKQGTITRWDDARGFGFIRSANTSADVFFHVRDFRDAEGRAPYQGLEVSFEEIHVGGKGPRGMAVQPLTMRAPAQRPAPKARRFTPAPPKAAVHRHRAGTASGAEATAALLLLGAYAAAILWGVWVKRLPWWTPLALALVNLFTFWLYWHDKNAAETRRWRVAESNLHLWGLAGGWPGAWLAQQVLRHKSRKVSFRSTYWATVLVHCGVLGAWLWWLAPLHRP